MHFGAVSEVWHSPVGSPSREHALCYRGTAGTEVGPCDSTRSDFKSCRAVLQSAKSRKGCVGTWLCPPCVAVASVWQSAVALLVHKRRGLYRTRFELSPGTRSKTSGPNPPGPRRGCSDQQAHHLSTRTSFQSGSSQSSEGNDWKDASALQICSVHAPESRTVTSK